MNRRGFITNPVVIFVSAQLAWLCLLGLWIFWYVNNYIIFTQVGERIAARMVLTSANVWALVAGLMLLITVCVGLSYTFSRLVRQISITRMYDNFIATVSHELKSPLASIRIHLDTMALRDVPPERRKEFIARMIRETARLEQLITSILDISSLEERKAAYRPEILLADPLIRGLVQSVERACGLEPGSIPVQGSLSCLCRVDTRAMEIVFHNIVENAVKYSPGKPEISVLLSESAGKALISVSDKGIGLSPSDQRNVFRKFWRAWDPESPNVKGTGLGLYWVREIVRHHRGTIRVASPGKMGGTTFRIALPVYRGRRAPHEESK